MEVDVENETENVKRDGIVVTGRSRLDVAADAWRAVIASKAKHRVFLHGDRLVRVEARGEEDDPAPTLREADSLWFRWAAIHAADWFSMKGGRPIPIAMPTWVGRQMMDSRPEGIPRLDGIACVPVFGREGTLLTMAGFHEADRLWMAPSASFSSRDVPAHPPAEDLAAARTLLLDELLGDFPFVAPCDRAYAISAILLPFARRLIPGAVPLYSVEAPITGTGRSLFAEIVGTVADGSRSLAYLLPNGESRICRDVAALLGLGRAIAILDNVGRRRPIRSESIAALASEAPRIGSAGKAPNTTLWILTPSDAGIAGIVAERSVRIRLDSGVSRPWLRSGFRHSDLCEWARSNRRGLVGAALTIVQAWLAAGRPSAASSQRGHFPAWTQVMGGILTTAGVPGFFERLPGVEPGVDRRNAGWAEFVRAWRDAGGFRPWKISELVVLCAGRGLLEDVRDFGSARSQETRLGVAMREVLGRRFGDVEPVRLAARRSGGAALYSLREVAPAE